ncbi:hypothetical protein Mapa_016152 [Marchantia paleacea]|nr:hypothetical protein Mapa_016152 [Marchantia paleacea]
MIRCSNSALRSTSPSSPHLAVNSCTSINQNLRGAEGRLQRKKRDRKHSMQDIFHNPKMMTFAISRS